MRHAGRIGYRNTKREVTRQPEREVMTWSDSKRDWVSRCGPTHQSLASIYQHLHATSQSSDHNHPPSFTLPSPSCWWHCSSISSSNSTVTAVPHQIAPSLPTCWLLPAQQENSTMNLLWHDNIAISMNS